MELIGTLAVAAGLMLAFLMLLVFKKGQAAKEDGWPFRVARDGRLMTEGKWFVYERLTSVLDKHVVFCQVGVGNFLEVVPEEGKKRKKGNEPGVNWRWKIDKKIVDFVICSKDGKVVAVVEMEDQSKEKSNDESKAKSKAKDNAQDDKDKALTSAGVRVVRWSMRTLPKKDEEIRKALIEPVRKLRSDEYEGNDDEVSLPILS